MDERGVFWGGALSQGGRVDLVALARRAGGLAALEAGGEDALVAAGLDREAARAWYRVPSLRSDWTIVCLGDEAYPAHLAECPFAPPVLFVEGDVGALSRPGVGIVGTRRCTGYGMTIARSLGAELAAHGVAVISGLARGIDANAHAGAVSAGVTVAVVGHGLAHTAPPGNRQLRRRIVESGGAVVSTFPDTQQAARWTFPARNRWIAALSRAVVVVEAPRRSGALITASDAVELQREVWAVPGLVTSSASEGCHDLIASGAQIVTGVRELVQSLCGLVRPPADSWLERLIEGATLDEVCSLAGCPMSELLSRVSELELRGELVRLPDGRYASSGSVAPWKKSSYA